MKLIHVILLICSCQATDHNIQSTGFFASLANVLRRHQDWANSVDKYQIKVFNDQGMCPAEYDGYWMALFFETLPWICLIVICVLSYKLYSVTYGSYVYSSRSSAQLAISDSTESQIQDVSEYVKQIRTLSKDNNHLHNMCQEAKTQLSELQKEYDELQQDFQNNKPTLQIDISDIEAKHVLALQILSQEYIEHLVALYVESLPRTIGNVLARKNGELIKQHEQLQTQYADLQQLVQTVQLQNNRLQTQHQELQQSMQTIEQQNIALRQQAQATQAFEVMKHALFMLPVKELEILAQRQALMLYSQFLEFNTALYKQYCNEKVEIQLSTQTHSIIT